MYTNMPPPPRRVPFNHHAINHPALNPAINVVNPRHIMSDTPPKPQDPVKPPSSPPLPRQNAKVTPPSPPKIITDKSHSVEFVRVGMLGEGGFARVYEVKDSRNNRSACKVVTKSSLKTKKAKTKLYAEIKIHRSLDHPNIVRFQECFEDDENVYMTLELCHNGSLMDMLRRRRRFTEPESRFFMVQLIGACHYMHTHQVIHRDLKLGNIFLDRNMNVKVGDFGLAALIENPGERKKTICGTPNYIAPEVLFDTANGHSFEVDTWSIGVILYTLVIGRPPFQTKDVKAIYKRIRDNEYEFPADRIVSRAVQELVQQTLTPDPQQRPTLHEIVDHEWFTRGIVPGYIPTTAHDGAPDWKHITRDISEANLKRLRRNAKLDEDQVTNIAVPSAPPPTALASGAAPNAAKYKGVSSHLAQQEKEFQKAIQPGSPISALLSSARTPLMVAPATARGENPVFRKLQAVSAVSRSPARVRLQNIDEEDDGSAKREEARKKELESQKARIVAQMVPGSAAPSACGQEDQENIPPSAARGELRTRERPREKVYEKAQDVPVADTGLPSSGSLPLRVNGFDAAAQTLTAAFDAKAAGRLFRDPREDAALPDPNVFIASWVDYCNKYGMGYALTDGSVGVHFNDSTTMVLSADKRHFDYISSRRQGSVYVRKNCTVSEYPEELKSKVYLLKHFERYIMDKLYGEYDYTFKDLDRTKGMDFVQKYLRMKHVIVFKMSHDVLQFNFYDHTKVILSSQGLLITHIDKNYKLTRWTLAEVMALALRPPATDPDQAKFNQRLLDKLKYCKEVLVSIQNASATIGQPANGQIEGGATVDPEGFAMPRAVPAMSARSSKTSLR
ncbi:hypothetical protein IEO21_03252 [Rhodonia placenta]|uniref:Serine/threonine-protein kinase n=1 Tax=Rhodonia placenta TaxID=104341 RepID=A0A8H7U3N1_9APHY|nr:hypothetical protein IEO21_03252 [Postia placenta]